MNNFEKVGHGANYDGYGVNDAGEDLNKDDLDSSYYNEKEISNEEEYKPGQAAAEVASDISFEEHLKSLAEQKKTDEAVAKSGDMSMEQVKDFQSVERPDITKKEVEENPAEDKRYIGKNGFVYPSREDAINSYKD